MPNIVKITTFPGLLDLLCPHFCRGCGQIGAPICDRCKNYIISQNPHTICPNCGHDTRRKPDFCPIREPGGGGRNVLFEGPKTWPTAPWDARAERGGPERPEKSTCGQDPRHRFLRYHKDKFFTNACPFCHFPLSYVVGPRTGVLDQLIHAYKYDSTRAIANPLASMLDAAIYEKLPDSTIIIPLPTTSRHVRERALDHTYQLARRLAKKRGWRVQKLLVRDKNTVQVGSTRKDRLRQAIHAYTLAPDAKIDPTATYLLLDDVWTTGASMRAAIEHLRRAGVPPDHLRVALLAVSH